MSEAKRRLGRMSIKGFKSIREQDIDLSAINVLIGANGSGKSNFISLFELLNAIAEERLQAYTGVPGADSLLHYGRQMMDSIELELHFEGANVGWKNGYEISLIPSEQGTLIFQDERIYLHNTKQYESPRFIHLGSGHRETNLYRQSKTSWYRNAADHVIDALKQWEIYHFHDTSASSKMKQSQDIEDNRFLRSDGSNLAAYLYFLKQKHNWHYQRIVKLVQRVTPFFDDFVLEPRQLNPDQIQLRWREKGQKLDFPPNALSDGTLRFIALATLLAQPELPSTILIDEPELGLHPYAITILSGLIRQAAQVTQVIVSTQSVPFIDQFDVEDVIVVDRLDGQSHFQRLNREKLEGWLEEYTVSELWEKNVLGGRPQNWKAHLPS